MDIWESDIYSGSKFETGTLIKCVTASVTAQFFLHGLTIYDRVEQDRILDMTTAMLTVSYT